MITGAAPVGGGGSNWAAIVIAAISSLGVIGAAVGGAIATRSRKRRKHATPPIFDNLTVAKADQLSATTATNWMQATQEIVERETARLKKDLEEMARRLDLAEERAAKADERAAKAERRADQAERRADQTARQARATEAEVEQLRAEIERMRRLPNSRTRRDDL